jgi:hypothetical protein
VGAPQLDIANAQPGGDFALTPKGPPTVSTLVVKTKTGTAVTFTSKMAIDADGEGGLWKMDKTDKLHGNDGSKTAAKYANGRSLDPRNIPYIVIPGDFGKTHPGVHLGDCAAVTYKLRTSYAIVGDVGPNGVLGEGSPSLARSLTINPDPNKGGVSTPSVTYVILPGTKGADLPRSNIDTQAQCKKLFDQAAPVR